METRPFDPNSYEDEIDEDEVMDEEGRARLKLKVENTIRSVFRFEVHVLIFACLCLVHCSGNARLR